MAVYKRSYKPYTGPLTALRRRWLVVTRFSLATAFSSRISIVAFVLCLVPPLVGAFLIYLSNNDLVQAALGVRNARGGSAANLVGNQFFVLFLEIQAWLALFLTAWVGPATIAPDLSNNALPLFLSRPLSRAEYIAGKVLVLAGTLSCITWVPLLIMFLLQAQLSKTPWFTANWYILPGIFFGCWLWIAVLSLVTLAVSSWVKWRIVATGATIAILMVPAGFGGVISGVLRTKWGLLLNVPYLMTLIWTDLLRVPLPLQAVPVPAAWAMMLGTAALSLLVLTRRIQARQVVRG
jgi:ABC-type transport system involved in multi-copper enzyme maturation permease subunit